MPEHDRDREQAGQAAPPIGAVDHGGRPEDAKGAARNGLVGIQGYRDRPTPRKASWPRRFQFLLRRRSERRFRAYAFPTKVKVETGSAVVEGWRGEDKRPGYGRRGRRPWGSLRARRGRRRVKHPPFRSLSREQRAKLASASRDEIARMEREAFETILGFREGKGLPDEVWRKIQREVGPIDPNDL